MIKDYYNLLTFKCFLASRRTSLSCETAQWIPRLRINRFCDICWLEKRPPLRNKTRTQSNAMAHATNPMTIKRFSILHNNGLQRYRKNITCANFSYIFL